MKYSRRFESVALWRVAINILLLVTLSICTLQITVYAQEQPILKASFSRDANQIINIDLVVGQSRVIELDEPCDVIQISADKIVSATVMTARTIVINAVGIGQAQVAVAKKITPPNLAEQTLLFRVFVQKDLSLLDNQIKILYPKENIQLSQVNESVVMSGSVTNPEISKGIEAILKNAKIDFTNLLKIPQVNVPQVQMEVRIAEVNRATVRQIGTAFGIMNRTIPAYVNPGILGTSAQGGIGEAAQSLVSISGATSIFLGRPDLTSAFIQALQERNAIRSLAEPNIIAAHGEIARFQSGGKIPVPQVNAASNGVSGFNVQFQDYGVMLEFTPTIKDENHITIKIKTEVSTLDYSNAVSTNNIRTPALAVNSASTILELADGQSFALAGLLSNSESANIQQIPGLANIPILGELFKSRNFRRNESELMFLCTVRMVTPLNPDQIPRLPGAPPSNTNAPAKPDAATSGAAIAPMLNTAPSSLSFPTAGALEGESGHAVPRKVVKAKSDN
jgi:pilus assembly protein CpaC